MKKLRKAMVLVIMLLYSCSKSEYPGHGQQGPGDTVLSKAPEVPLDTSQVAGVFLMKKVNVLTEVWVWIYNDQHTAYLPLDTVLFNGFSCKEGFFWPSNNIILYPENLYHTENVRDVTYYLNYRIDSSVRWQAKSEGNAINIDYEQTGVFPAYSDSMSTTMNISTGLTFNFDSLHLVGADSIQLTFGNNADSLTRTFEAKQGMVNISYPELAFLLKGQEAFAGYFKYTAYKLSVQYIGGRNYAFIKEQSKGISVTYVK